jgi:hypothetical protein
MAQGFVFVFDLVEFARGFGAELDHILKRWAVLALQAIEQGEAVFHFGEVLGRGLNAAGIVAQGCAHVFYADARGFDGRESFLKFGLEAGKFFDLFLRRAQR